MKAQKLNDSIVTMFTNIINEQFEAVSKGQKVYDSIPEMFKFMRNKQLETIKESNKVTDVKSIKDQTMFMFLLCEAIFKSKLNLGNDKNIVPEQIAMFVYHNIVISGLHNCPDVYINDMKKVVKNLIN